MTLVWVTGVSGSGKSSVCEALKGNGHWAVDADWEGYSHWVHRVTGEVVLDPPYPVPPRWLERFAWKISVERVGSLAIASSGVTFLCGSAENERDAWPHFDHAVCLVIDDETLRHRLATRTTNEFGKHPDELEAALARNRAAKTEYRNLGATLVDATRSLDDVVRDVLAMAGPATALEDCAPTGKDIATTVRRHHAGQNSRAKRARTTGLVADLVRHITRYMTRTPTRARIRTCRPRSSHVREEAIGAGTMR